MPKITAAEMANFLDGLADGYEIDMQGKSDYHSEWIKKLRYSASILRRVASGELAPVVHAHWIQKVMPLGTKYCVCSNCNYGVDNITKRCPSCDALMDGKEDNHE